MYPHRPAKKMSPSQSAKMVQWDILTKNCANGGADQKSGKCSVRYLSALDESDMFGTHQLREQWQETVFKAAQDQYFKNTSFIGMLLEFNQPPLMFITYR